MSLLKELEIAKQSISAEGYEMSIGELINLYKEGELYISPPYQRLFRWDDDRKVSFIESLLLGIPIPSIFVSETEDGKWELIDGLQRISTIIQFMGEALDSEEQEYHRNLILSGTKHLPSLEKCTWKELDNRLRLSIKRTRIRVEILLSKSDKSARYEVFQRLNTGGANLSYQEVRNCTTIMINPEMYHDFFVPCSEDPNFIALSPFSEKGKQKSEDIELVLKHFSLKMVAYKNHDIRDFLDQANITLSENTEFNISKNLETFKKTFAVLNEAFGNNAFKEDNISGRKLKRLYDILSVITSEKIDSSEVFNKKAIISEMKDIKTKLMNDEEYQALGAGVGAKTGVSTTLNIISKFINNS